jgi:hypothetical protein
MHSFACGAGAFRELVKAELAGPLPLSTDLAAAAHRERVLVLALCSAAIFSLSTASTPVPADPSISLLIGPTSNLVDAAREAAASGDALELTEWLEGALQEERRRQVLRAALPEMDVAGAVDDVAGNDNFQEAGILELAARSGRLAAAGGPL